MATQNGIASELEKILPAERQWSTQGIRHALALRNINPPVKQVYNSLAYLTRTKKLTKIGYGLYVIGPKPFSRRDGLSTADRDAMREALKLIRQHLIYGRGSVSETAAKAAITAALALIGEG